MSSELVPWPMAKASARLAALRAGLPGGSGGVAIPPGPVALLMVGQMRPVHLGHLAALARARSALEAQGLTVLAAWLAPRPDTVCRRYGPAESLRVHAARCVAVAGGDVECGTWLAGQAPPPLTVTLGSLQAALRDAFPELVGALSTFVVCDVRGSTLACESVRAEDLQGVVIVPRAGETLASLPPCTGYLVAAAALEAPVGQYSGSMARALLVAGDADAARRLLPEGVARLFLQPTAEEQAAFGRELADLSPVSSRPALLAAAAVREWEIGRPFRERLRAWFGERRGGRSLLQLLGAYDTDADGHLSLAEAGRIATDAGFAPLDAAWLMRGLGIGPRGEALRAIVDRLEGVPLTGKPLHAPAAADEGDDDRECHIRMRTLVKQATAMQAELRSRLLGLVAEPAAAEAELVRTLAGTPWRAVYQIRDGLGCSLLLLASAAGLHTACAALLTAEGADSTERFAYANAPNDMGWTPLQRACHNGHLATCKLLLEARADLNLATRGTGLAPLMLAASNGHKDVVQLLLAGAWPGCADPWQTAADGRVALDFVRARLRAHRQLAPDHAAAAAERQALEAAGAGAWRAAPDAYGVRSPCIAEPPEPFSDIERILLKATGDKNVVGELHVEHILFDAERDL